MDAREANTKKRIWSLANGLHAISEAGDIALARLEMGTAISPGVHDGMMNAITTLYSRPFTSNKGVGRMPNVENDLSEESRSTHDFLLMQRNMTGAHSDARTRFSDSERAIRDLKLVADYMPDGGFVIGHELPIIRIEASHLESIIALVAEIRPLVEAKLDEMIGQIYWDEEKQSPVAEAEGMVPGDHRDWQLNLHEALDFGKSSDSTSNG